MKKKQFCGFFVFYSSAIAIANFDAQKAAKSVFYLRALLKMQIYGYCKKTASPFLWSPESSSLFLLGFIQTLLSTFLDSHFRGNDDRGKFCIFRSALQLSFEDAPNGRSGLNNQTALSF